MTDNLPELLAARLQPSLPGPLAQRQMEPELSFGRHFGPPRYDARPAAVVALLVQRRGEWFLPLMVRPDSMAHHAGQISLPGGAIEPGESCEEAALRELEEELGVPRMAALLLGQLTPLYVYGTNFLVTPWVAAIRREIVFQPNPAEVAAVLEVPLAHLMDLSHRGEHLQTRGTVVFRAPHFNWSRHQIWGATSMILAELIALI
ncbi:MAG: CoA pyrophosphatase [Pirellulales bacterium]|nr:CoA pyrophosphatase [Pirellulales bacterium]